MRINHHWSGPAGVLCTALVLGATACSTSEDGVASASATTTQTATAPEVVYRERTAYEFSACWRNEDGSISFLEGAARPSPTAVIGTVRLYVPFDLDGSRLTDAATFTRCSFES